MSPMGLHIRPSPQSFTEQAGLCGTQTTCTWRGNLNHLWKRKIND